MPLPRRVDGVRGAAPERFALGPFVERSGAAWMPAAERRGGRVFFDWRAGPTSVRSDPRRLAQAFANLLANAVEHGGGEIVVRGRPSRDGVRVEIEDRGAGARLPRRKTLARARASNRQACGRAGGRPAQRVRAPRRRARGGGRASRRPLALSDAA